MVENVNVFAHWVIIVVVFINIAGNIYLLVKFNKNTHEAPDEGQLMPHAFDGIQEVNNPLPRWWVGLYWMTIASAVIYLALYPGLGNFGGLFGNRTLAVELEEVNEKYDAEINKQFALMASLPIATIANPKTEEQRAALNAGKNIFTSGTCALCHQQDAKGIIGDSEVNGYPNLTDKDWLYGGSPEAIIATIANGRSGSMPAHLDKLQGDEIKSLAYYVKSLSDKSLGKTADGARKVKAGTDLFAKNCTTCHGAKATGGQNVGAPNLTDNIWLHGNTLADIEHTIKYGRNSKMPAHGQLLTKEQIHLAAAYVYSLSLDKE